MMLSFIFPGIAKDGISDYALVQYEALCQVAQVHIFSYQQLLEQQDAAEKVNGCDISLIHFNEEVIAEYWKIIQKINSPKIITLHEIYQKSPFNFPRPKLRSKFDLWTGIRRFKYDLTHFAEIRKNFRIRNLYHADHVVVNEKYHKNLLLQKGVPEQKIDVVPLGVSPVKLKKSKGILKKKYGFADKFVLSTFGFLNVANNYAAVLQGLKQLPEEIVYIIVGGKRLARHVALESEIIARVRQLDLETRVVLTGYVPIEAVNDYLSFTDVYVAPFKFKSASSSLNHAFAHHLPIVAAKIDFTEALNKEHHCLQLYGSTSEFCGKIIMLKDDNAYRQHCVNKVKETTAARSMGKVCQKIVSICERLVNVS